MGLELFFFIISEHSNADLLVGITSSIISTFAFFGILKPLQSINYSLNLSAKIVSIDNCLPTS